MNPSILQYLQKASQLLADAKLLFAEDRFDSAADRTYYAFYWSAQAALLSKNIVTKSHRGLSNQFSKEFVKDGPVSKESFRHLKAAFRLRHESTYEAGALIDESQLEVLIHQAELFINEIEGIVNELEA